jgi:hypothetical protein
MIHFGSRLLILCGFGAILRKIIDVTVVYGKASGTEAFP